MTRFALPTRKRRRLAKATALIAATRLFEAEAQLSDAVERWPNDFDVRLQHAFCAHNSGRYDDALERWDRIRAQWPECAMAWSGSACNARELGRLEEARSIIAEAHRRFPTDLIALSEGIRIYDQLRASDRSIALLTEIVRLAPEHLGWRRDCCDRLLGAGRIDEAIGYLREVPAAADDLALCRARIAMIEGSWDRADGYLQSYLPDEQSDQARVDEVRRVASMMVLHEPQKSCLLYGHAARVRPNDPAILHGRADALIRSGRCAEAEAVICAALGDHPHCEDLLFDRAHVALKTERWDEAVAQFEALVRRRPARAEAKPLLARARAERAQAELEAGEAQGTYTPERQDVGLVQDPAARQILLDFESLGQDCEFGLVQRHFGAEPLGLFRWTFTTPVRLQQALDQSLEGLGEAKQTSISLWDDYEYKISDSVWNFNFHTWISRHEADRDDVYRKMCRRIGFLKGKFLEDLSLGRKTFVLKSFDTGPDEVRALLAALRTFGPAHILWVRSLEMDTLLAQRRRSGELEEVEPGLYAGYISNFGNRPSGPWQIDFQGWVDLCRKVLDIRSPADAL